MSDKENDVENIAEAVRLNREEIPKATMEQCKILYCQKDLPMTKTCMCWGWECGPGWYDAIRNLSCALEVLNIMFYERYRCRIQADQVKEKFGTLHFYHSVICENYNERGLELKKVIDAFEAKKDSDYFKLKRVVDEPGRSEEVDDGGKKRSVWHPPVSRMVATEHADEFERMSKEADEARDELVEHGTYEPTDEQRVIMNYLDSTADRLVREAEHECYNTCESCGRQIGTDYSPRCETKGWIRYLCKRCFEKGSK